MRVISIATTLILLGAAALLDLVSAADPAPTFGHSAILVDSTVFIQGGTTTGNTPTNAAFALILDITQGGSYAGATMLDMTTLANLSARDFHGAVETTTGLMVSCGTVDGGSGTMTCDEFNVVRYNSTPMDKIPDTVAGRGGMAVGLSGISAYFLGGSTSAFADASKGFSTDMDILMISSSLRWRKGTNMPTATRFHTATWIDSTVGGLVVLGGQLQGGTAVSMNNATLFVNSIWTTRAIAGDAIPARFGHSAVTDENGLIYVYGGMTTAAGPALNDFYVLDTKVDAWAWKKLAVPSAEPRAFHASVLLPDGDTILHTFGLAGAGPNTAVSTISSYGISKNAWVAAAAPPAATVATTSPNKLPATNNIPGDPNYKHPSGDDEDEKKSNVGMIAGIAVACVVVLAVGGFLFHRRRRQLRPSSTSTAGVALAGQGAETGEGGTKLGRSFTIRKPTDAYVVDDRDLGGDQYPQYRSDQDVQTVPYYGDRKYNPNDSLQSSPRQYQKQQYEQQPYQEYELNDTSRSKYSGSQQGYVNSHDIAATQRMVEQEQLKMMKGYQQMSAEFAANQIPISQKFGTQQPTTGRQKDYEYQKTHF
ncbi:hypothetical protein EMPS_04616 [Entomortierella parvispora]|uniref:Galactose oxidase n=1 Tax=Entomortierella parvispora TaxID=205924 RepID=A0A9P3H8Z0_9FUNG|nr:hypothetical protein EMPS_04616 [Entomortierella parvispora]